MMIAETGTPLVSMIVISYDHSRFVLETLESVKAQTYKTTELIIVDDRSTDDSATIIERWLRENAIACTFIRHHENSGICKSFNDALAVATGKYISAVAADDVWLSNKIARQVEIMESQPEDVGVMYTEAFQIDANGNLLPEMHVADNWQLPPPQGHILDMLLQRNFIPGMTTLVRRSCYDKVGLYDETLPWEDWDMWLRMARHYSFIYSPIPSAKYRLHEKSLARSDPWRMMKDVFKVLLKQLRAGDLTDDQKSALTQKLLSLAAKVYDRNDKQAPEILLALWRATGDKKAAWMYRFAKLGISYRNWLRADNCRLRLQRLRIVVTERP